MTIDHPWKEALESHLREALEFMFPGIAPSIDWSSFPRSLEQEVRKALPDSASGDRIVDRVLGCATHQGDERYVHLEVQGRKQDHFPNRVVDYNDGARLHLGHPVVSVAVLVDPDPDWRPRHVRAGGHGLPQGGEVPRLQGDRLAGPAGRA